MVAFFHPSTAKTWFPVSAYPFRQGYPYTVSLNTPVTANGPDRIFQPYVNLALKYGSGQFSPYHLGGRQAVFVLPILPHPLPKNPDSLEYGLPFRTQSGLGRLLAELNLFLHQIEYGRSNLLNRWSGQDAPSGIRTAPADEKHFFLDERAAPPLRRVATMGFSASSLQLDNLLATEDLNHPRYRAPRWGASKNLSAFKAAWLETWALDLFFETTVLRAQFERDLLNWFGRNESRSFIFSNSGTTTGGADPSALYAEIRKMAVNNERFVGADPSLGE
jgi:hypothetical protein